MNHTDNTFSNDSSFDMNQNSDFPFDADEISDDFSTLDDAASDNVDLNNDSDTDNPFEDDFDDSELADQSAEDSDAFDDDFDDGDLLGSETGDEELLNDNSGNSDLSETVFDGSSLTTNTESKPEKAAITPSSPTKKSNTPTSSQNKLIARWCVAAVALLFGIIVLIIVKVNGSYEKSTSTDYDNKSSYNDVSDPTDHSSVSSEPEAVSSQQPEYQELHYKDYSDDVMKMQKRLCELGFFDEKSCTGYYGDFTVKRIKAFQKKAGLEETGKADSVTLARLYADDAPKA